MVTTSPYPQPELLKEEQSSPTTSSRQALMNLHQLYAVRTRAREKYARRMQRDPEGFRAKRRAIQRRYYYRQRPWANPSRPGVKVELIF